MAGAAARTLSNAEIEGEIRAFAASDPRILAAYLFGSRGRREETEQSDVDVGVLFRQEVSLHEVLLLEDALEQRLGLPVDLIDAGKASAFLALDILRGERVFCADLDRCDEFELYVMRRAGDLAPFERERRRLLLQP
ncbi:MAG TPA: nucleotidyltransferase domain-containing protein [Thermoanaerobaculia bacterium]|nr:nucleotidyltransferase domain-containing protein [Thermoanaerobaculia bacterium]